MTRYSRIYKLLLKGIPKPSIDRIQKYHVRQLVKYTNGMYKLLIRSNMSDGSDHVIYLGKPNDLTKGYSTLIPANTH